MKKKARPRPCPYDKYANTTDCGNPYMHWEKERLIEALIYCHQRIAVLELNLSAFGAGGGG